MLEQINKMVEQSKAYDLEKEDYPEIPATDLNFKDDGTMQVLISGGLFNHVEGAASFPYAPTEHAFRQLFARLGKVVFGKGTNKMVPYDFFSECDTEQLAWNMNYLLNNCLLYTSPSPRDRQRSRMPSSA